jgi:hypothetical protein
MPSGVASPDRVETRLGTLNFFDYRIHAVRVRSALHLRSIQGPVDWTFHNAVPVGASVILILGGGGWVVGAVFAPFAIAGASTLLLASGIYRTWGETLALIGTRDKS